MTEGIEERTATQEEQAARQRAKSALITFAVWDALQYLDELQDNGELELDSGEDFYDLRLHCEAIVRKALEEELSGDERQDQADRLARDLVDAELED